MLAFQWKYSAVWSADPENLQPDYGNPIPDETNVNIVVGDGLQGGARAPPQKKNRENV